MADREKFIKCDCHGEGILVTKYDDEEEMYFSYWREGINPIKLSWRMRLKLCYLALFKGNFYNDQVILNKEKAMELALWIQEEHDDITTWVREVGKEGDEVKYTSPWKNPMPSSKEVIKNDPALDKTKFAVGNLLDRKPLDQL